MGRRNIIVIGASAGGFEAIKMLVAGLPPDLNASIFIVWHIAPDLRGILPQVINRVRTLPASNAVDGDPIQPGHIYVAPPDRHLLVEDGRVRVTHGPKENRFRPAVDPLFRSAAYAYGSRVIGVILSGALDDGTSGLWTIKDRGGLAIVQDPADAEVPSMPESALRAISVDYKVPIAEMAGLLVRLTNESVSIENPEINMEEHQKTEREVRIAMQDKGLDNEVMKLGDLSPYACPDCHGVLTALKEGGRVRYRCHTGHAYSTDTLLTALTEKIEDCCWSAIRGIEESILLLNDTGDRLAAANQPRLAASYFKKAGEAGERMELVRKAVLKHEQLSTESIRLGEEAEASGKADKEQA